MNWASYPFLRIAMAFVCGVLLKPFIEQWSIALETLLLSGGLFLVIYLLISQFVDSQRFQWINIALALLVFMHLGALSAQLKFNDAKPDIASEILSKTTHYSAEIRSIPSKTAKTIKYEAEITHIKTEGEWIRFRKRSVLYFLGEEHEKLEYGTKLIAVGNLDFVKEQTNPNAFNYAKYLRRKGIFLNGFLAKGDYKCIENSSSFSIPGMAIKAGNAFEVLLEKNISGERELSLVKSLVIGRRSEVSSEMQEIYQDTGTSHILAVSGLHVGIVYFLATWLFKIFNREKLNLVYHGLILISIWSYAFITGGSPSVLRASLMFSVIVVGNILSRKSKIQNSILVSAFALLLVDPDLLYSVSFQLSYLAVFGIIFLYRKIYSLIYIPNRFLDFFWQITAVSLSVQVFTFPVTIYYFHQFPILFPDHKFDRHPNCYDYPGWKFYHVVNFVH